jgi:glycosyltransferase involved in cell wall biosynthesis
MSARLNVAALVDSVSILVLLLKVRYGDHYLASKSKSEDANGIFVVVPCYDEATRLDAVAFVDFVEAHAAYHFVFVNDGSTDNTAGVLRDLASRVPEKLFHLDLPENSGKAEAVRRGVLSALTHKPQAVAFWDADLSTPLSELPAFVDILRDRPDVELVVGARVKLMGRTIERKGTRHLSGRVFATMASLTLRLPFYDTQCGAKMFRATEVTESLFAEPFGSRWLFDVELCARLIRARGHEEAHRVIFEYPLREWIDVEGSKLSYWDFVRAVRELYDIYRKYPELRDS